MLLSKRHNRMNQDGGGVTILNEGCRFEGTLTCSGSTRIAGVVEGEIVSTGFLMIEESANIRANVQAEDVIIHGSVAGVLRASGRVELAPGCRFDGDIATPSITVRDGAQFNGRCAMDAQATIDAVLLPATHEPPALQGASFRDVNEDDTSTAAAEAEAARTPDPAIATSIAAKGKRPSVGIDR